MSKLRLSVENFGPVRHGTFELSPLTVFIGPNNTGKSYIALLLYALCQAVSTRRLHSPYGWSLPRSVASLRAAVLEHQAQGDVRREFRRLLLRRPYAWQGKLTWKQLPEQVQQLFASAIEDYASSTEGELGALLQNYFGFQDPRELVKHGSTGDELSVQVRQRNARSVLLGVEFAAESNDWRAQWHLPPPRSLSVEVSHRPSDDQDMMDFALGLLEGYWGEMMSASGFPRGHAYYLPSARSGILGAWQVFASMAVDIARRQFGLRRIEVPAFTGVTGDFLQTLFAISQRPLRRPAMAAVLEAMNSDIFHGQVTFLGRRQTPPSIVYTTGNSQLPIHRASSMVGELAPLSLWVQHVLEPGDLLVIDEPEAHLHPESQRHIARVLVRLVRAGVTVLCTTHSSLILHQLSNHIMVSQAGPQDQHRFGFTAEDVLKADEVGVFLFAHGSKGTQIKRVPVEPYAGIDEDEFVRVMEAIGDQTYRLALQQDLVPS